MFVFAGLDFFALLRDVRDPPGVSNCAGSRLPARKEYIMRLRTVLSLGLMAVLFAGGGIALAGNASAADNTSVRVHNEREKDLGKDITFCAETRSGSKRCANEIGKGRHGTVGIEIQQGEEVEIFLTKGPDISATLTADHEPGSRDIECFASESALACRFVDKR